MGEELIKSVELISHAQLHLGIDSFSQHICHMTKTPAIILWGSTQVSASGYPENVNISLGLDCQPCFFENPEVSNVPRGVCSHHSCMTGITVERIIGHVRSKINDSLPC